MEKFDYLGTFVYSRDNDTLTFESTNFAGGRINKTNSAYDINYFITDHLGSTRVIIDNAGEIKAQYNYYPFGRQWEDLNLMANTNRYTFSGKEKQTVKDLGYLDFGARMLRNETDPPGWMSIDPLCEKYYSLSPYMYCAGNPIRFVDPDGLYYYDWNDKIYRTDAGEEVSWDEIVRNNYLEPQKIENNPSLSKSIDFMKQSSLWSIIEKGLIYDIDTKKIVEGTVWIEGMPTKLAKDGKLFVVSAKTGKYVDIMDSSLKREFDQVYQQQLDSPFHRGRFYWSPVSDDRAFQVLIAAFASNSNPISIPLYGVAKDVNNAYTLYTNQLIEKRMIYYQKYNIIKNE
jgi:RHS repeat-associated protein